MRILTLALPALAGLLIGAQPCFAQTQPGAPTDANGAPMAPNSSVTPSMQPGGANVGMQPGATANSGMMSVDPSTSSQTAQPNTGMTRAHRAGRVMSGSTPGNGMTNDPSSTMAPASATPPNPTAPPK